MGRHGYIVVLEAGDNVRDLGNVGLNREDGRKEPQFFAVTCDTVPRIGLLVKNPPRRFYRI
ncbi:hypothetical protein GCM10008933_32330 [Paenibacillus motobuensis]|uniref:Uncharacterized protein n=1 Tax=Paenibacillus motobuensis TaxID=295324 RepID=A0ABN0YL45_9BACL